jgi:hypothetical protein
MIFFIHISYILFLIEKLLLKLGYLLFKFFNFVIVVFLKTIFNYLLFLMMLCFVKLELSFFV